MYGTFKKMCIQKCLTIQAPSQDRRTWMCPHCTLSLRDSYPSAAAHRCGRCRTSGSLLGAGTWGAAGSGRWAPSLRRRGRRIRRLRHLQQKCFIVRVITTVEKQAFISSKMTVYNCVWFFNRALFVSFVRKGSTLIFMQKTLVCKTDIWIFKSVWWIRKRWMHLGSNMACTNYN